MCDKGLALVVGGSGGIGAAISRGLAENGWDIALTYRAGLARAEQVALEVTARSRTVSLHALDLADPEAPGQTIAEVVSQHSRLDALIYAAGPLVRQLHLSKLPDTLLAEYLMSDTMGFFRLTQAALPALRASEGAVVACHSAAQYRYAPADGLSVIPKAAVTATLMGIAKEEGRFGVRANGVAIGLIEAGQQIALSQSGELDSAYFEAAAKATPLRRPGQAEDVAEAVAFFADKARSGFVTGQTLCVDGGYSV